MKKLIVLALFATLACGAYASSVAVPWFNDMAAPLSGTGPSSVPGIYGSLLSTYITLKNNQDDNLLCAIEYTDAKGNDMTPVENTFIINAGAAIGFRPYRDDISEAPNTGFGGPAENLVPNCTADPTGLDPLPAGSAKISWVGGPKDVQGMVVLSNMRLESQASYLLPPGL